MQRKRVWPEQSKKDPLLTLLDEREQVTNTKLPMYQVYKLFHLSHPDEVYIGSTSLSLHDRKLRHFHSAWLQSSRKDAWIRSSEHRGLTIRALAKIPYYHWEYIERVWPCRGLEMGLREYEFYRSIAKMRARKIEQVAIIAYRRAGFFVLNERASMKDCVVYKRDFALQ